MRTEFEFVLPRGYVDEAGALHRTGTMRLATARDELEPLRDPTIQGPDDPRLTILVLARVVRTLGTINLVTPHEIEGLFAADLAYLQDFYGVVNFGTDADIDALLDAQRAAQASERTGSGATAAAATAEPPAAELAEPAAPQPAAATTSDLEDRPVNRRAAIQEVRSSGR